MLPELFVERWQGEELMLKYGFWVRYVPDFVLVGQFLKVQQF
jgi:hypothetical protein